MGFFNNRTAIYMTALGPAILLPGGVPILLSAMFADHVSRNKKEKKLKEELGEDKEMDSDKLDIAIDEYEMDEGSEKDAAFDFLRNDEGDMREWVNPAAGAVLGGLAARYGPGMLGIELHPSIAGSGLRTGLGAAAGAAAGWGIPKGIEGVQRWRKRLRDVERQMDTVSDIERQFAEIGIDADSLKNLSRQITPENVEKFTEFVHDPNRVLDSWLDKERLLERLDIDSEVIAKIEELVPSEGFQDDEIVDQIIQALKSDPEFLELIIGKLLRRGTIEIDNLTGEGFTGEGARIRVPSVGE